MNNESLILNRGVVYYSDFGAVGDGKADDFEAIFAAHEFANANSLPVKADEGKTFYVHNFDRSAIIKTDTDFTGAKFIIDDTGSDAFINRSVPLYLVERDTPSVIYEREDMEKLFPGAKICVGDTVIPWLSGKLDGKSLIRFTNEDHRDFVRIGSNVNSGNPRTDVILVDTDGSVDPDTPIAFAFEKVTKMEIIRTDDKPITVQGGYFESICCRVVEETNFENKWRGYYRKFKILRTNTTMKDMTHRILNEPDIPNTEYGRGEDGKLSHSYPYYGFLYFFGTYNSKAINCALNSHTTYYEDKTTSDKPVPQGTYDLVVEYSSHVWCEGITSYVDICDTRYWGIMSSNGAKNMTFKGCSMSRFDAHRGFWNANLIDCEFGQTINVIGGGKLYIENTKRLAGRHFIAMRGDYGATFNGDIIIKNCSMTGYKTYRGVNRGAKFDDAIYVINSGFGYLNQKYLDWNFGYTCYMPRKLVIDNFKTELPGKTFVFNDIQDVSFAEENNNTYQITEEITYNNMEPLPTCNDGSCTALNNIPIKTDE